MYTNRAVDVNHGKMKQRPKYTGIKDYSYDGKYSDDSGEEIDLLNRRIHKPQQFVEADILDGDTLQAIALRFNCSVAAIKKANNIHRENEIFAKRKIKIPVTAFSLLTETIPLVHTSGSNSPTKLAERVLRNDIKAASITSDIDLQQKLIVASVNSAELSSASRVQSVANSNLSINNESTSGISSINDELVNCDIAVTNFNRESAPLLMVAPSKSTTVEDVVLNEFASKGADFGLKWIHLLIFVLILGVFIPLIYIFYIAEHPEKYLHHHNK